MSDATNPAFKIDNSASSSERAKFQRQVADEVNYIYDLDKREAGEAPRRIVITDHGAHGSLSVVLQWQQSSWGGSVLDWRRKSPILLPQTWFEAACIAVELEANDTVRDVATIEEEVESERDA